MDSDGSEFIFLTGAPGSKWSAIGHALMYADGINTSDVTRERVHEGDQGPLHFGNYFGPGMEYGDGFDDLSSMSKEDLVEELKAPYENPRGTLLVKSHMFSRHLPYLAQTFPRARFVLVHKPDDECLTWWKRAGGFRISFPDYTWYEDSENMAEQIALDNAGIVEFVRQQGKRLIQHRSMRPVLAALGLNYSTPRIAELAATEFETRFGLGGQPAAAVEDACHTMARLANVAVVNPTAHPVVQSIHRSLSNVAN